MSWKKYLPAPNELEYVGWPREMSLADYTAAAADAVEIVKASSSDGVRVSGGRRAGARHLRLGLCHYSQ